jgi:acetylornithine/N-succinyldiaminopimelate aminotransferase
MTAAQAAVVVFANDRARSFSLPVSDPETEMAASSPLMTTYAPQPIAFTHGDGVWLYDTEGRVISTAWPASRSTPSGHNHPKLVAALREQVARMMHTSNLFEVPLQVELATRLVRSRA